MRMRLWDIKLCRKHERESQKKEYHMFHLDKRTRRIEEFNETVSVYFYLLAGEKENLQHHLSSQAEAVLKQQTLCRCLELPDRIHILGIQRLLCICHGSQEAFFISAK